jgi:hypothetical protein
MWCDRPPGGSRSCTYQRPTSSSDLNIYRYYVPAKYDTNCQARGGSSVIANYPNISYNEFKNYQIYPPILSFLDNSMRSKLSREDDNVWVGNGDNLDTFRISLVFPDDVLIRGFRYAFGPQTVGWRDPVNGGNYVRYFSFAFGSSIISRLTITTTPTDYYFDSLNKLPTYVKSISFNGINSSGSQFASTFSLIKFEPIF